MKDKIKMKLTVLIPDNFSGKDSIAEYFVLLMKNMKIAHLRFEQRNKERVKFVLFPGTEKELLVIHKAIKQLPKIKICQ